MSRAGLPGRDDFAVLNTRDGNGALFTNVLRDNPVFHTGSIHKLDLNVASDRKGRRSDVNF